MRLCTSTILIADAYDEPATERVDALLRAARQVSPALPTYPKVPLSMCIL